MTPDWIEEYSAYGETLRSERATRDTMKMIGDQWMHGLGDYRREQLLGLGAGPAGFDPRFNNMPSYLSPLRPNRSFIGWLLGC